MKFNILYLLLLLLPAVSFSQTLEKTDPYALNPNYIGIKALAHTAGFGFGVNYFRNLGGNWDLAIGFELNSYKHRKEQKVESLYKEQRGKNFIYDKKNYFYGVTATAGISRVLIPASAHNRISVRATAAAGPTIGLLKPYYVEVAVPINATQAFVDEVPYDASQYSYFDIVGQADYFLGIDEIKPVFGMSWRIAAIVDFSRSTDYIRGVELAFMGDLFTKKVEIMDETKNRSLFLGGSLGFIIGNGW